jgi:hypothetical protein
MLPEEFADASLDTVTNYGASHTLRHRHSQTRRYLSSRKNIEHEQRCNESYTVLKDPPILAGVV